MRLYFIHRNIERVQTSTILVYQHSHNGIQLGMNRKLIINIATMDIWIMIISHKELYICVYAFKCRMTNRNVERC